jgi:hypothetical protein
VRGAPTLASDLALPLRRHRAEAAVQFRCLVIHESLLFRRIADETHVKTELAVRQRAHARGEVLAEVPVLALVDGVGWTRRVLLVVELADTCPVIRFLLQGRNDGAEAVVRADTAA